MISKHEGAKMQIDIMIVPWILGLLGAFFSGIIAALVKLGKESEVRNREGDFRIAAETRRIRTLFMSTVPSALNFTSQNVTLGIIKQIIYDTERKTSQILDALFAATSKCSKDSRKQAYTIGVRIQNLDPIHIVQGMVWNSDIGAKLPNGGLGEYLKVETRDDEGEAHLGISEILKYVTSLRKQIEEKYFNESDMDLYALKETETPEPSPFIKKLVSKASKTLREKKDGESEILTNAEGD